MFHLFFAPAVDNGRTRVVHYGQRTGEGGSAVKWVEGFSISVRVDGDAATVSANREGLLSLANHLAELAQEPPGSHIHLDAYNSLESGSAELIIERREA